MKKILSVVASLAILANSLLYPFAYAYAQEETSTPEPTPIIEEIVTPSPEPTIEPTATPSFEPTSSPEADQPLAETPSPSPWTFEKVELNKEYIAPQNSEVKLTFTKLPDPSGSIKIEEITLTEDQIKQTGSLSDKAYDITSDMENGSFTYNLSLPIPEASKGKSVEVKFAEEIAQLGTAEKVENSLTKTDASVSVTSLDHFTIFVVSGLTESPLCTGASIDPPGETTACYSTIQAAIDAATGSATINVAAGTYNENLTIDESITLQGTDKTTTIINGTGTGSVVTITANNVTFKNFTVQNSGKTGTEAGILVQGISGVNVNNNIVTNNFVGIGLAAATSNNIENNTLTLNYFGIYVGTDTNPSTGNTIKDNNISTTIKTNLGGGNYSGDGVYGDLGCNGNTFTNNNVHNNGKDGFYFWKSATNTVTNNTVTSNAASGFELMGSKNNDFSNNTVTGNLDGFRVRWSDSYDSSPNTLTGNTINNTNYNVYAENLGESKIVSVSAVNNWWNTSVSGNIIAKLIGDVTYDPYYVNSGKAILSNSIPAIVYVDDGYTDGIADGHYFGYDAFPTIQDGITAVANGGTVNVAAGIYIEVGQIVINKNLTIVGADKTTTIIKPAEDTGDSGSLDARSIILVNVGKVFNLSNTTIDGTGKSVSMGILSHGTGTINNNIIKNIQSSQYYGRGIQMYGDNSPTNVSMTVTNNTLSGIGRIGIMAFGPGVTSGVISGNNYTGKGDGVWLDYGIEVGNGAQVTISGNTVTRNTGVASDVDNSTSAGIVVTTLFGSGTQATITGNTLTGNTEGIAVGGTAGDTSTVVAHLNNLSGNTDFGIASKSVASVDATNNWWGSAVETDIQSKISGDVDHDPWWIDSAMTHSSLYITIHNILENADILNNIDSCGLTPNDCIGLYFEKTDFGKISFSGTLDLTNQTTIDFLTGLDSELNMNSGRIALDVSTAAALANKGATLEMYNIMSPVDEGNIVVRNDAGVIQNPSGIVSGFAYDAVNHKISFSAAHFTQFDIDTTAPVIEAHTNVGPVEATTATGATVTYTAPNATDNIDATAPASCTPTSGSTFALGNTTVTCNKTDTAGNSATQTFFTVTVQDTTNPTNVTTSDSGTFTNNPHLTFTWPASTDLASGISYYESWLSTAKSESNALDLDTGSSNEWINVGNVTSYTLADAEAALLSTGTQYFAKVKAVDNVGNVAITGSFSWSDGITLDTIAPIISFVDKTAPNANGWNNGNVTVNWNCSDTGSGPISATVSQTVTSEGTNQSSTGTCTDNAGNTASNTQTGINIDKTVPSVPSITTPAQTMNTGTIDIIGTAEADSTVTIAGGASTATGTATGGNFNITVTLTHNTVNNLSVTAKDLANNPSTATVEITHDDIAPTVTTLGDGDSDYSLPDLLEDGKFGVTLIFNEELSTASKTAVKNALNAGADKTLTFRWGSGDISNKLRISVTGSETATFANDVVVNVSDVAGNTTNSALLVDSKLDASQVAPVTGEDGSGTATADTETPEVVITDPYQLVDITITDGTDNPTIDVSAFVTNGEGDIPQINIISATADIEIPATTVTGPDDWNGIIAAPTVTTIDLPVVSGETSTLGTAIEIGFATDKLSFDNAIRILLPNQAGKRAGYSRPGTDFTEITTLCGEDTRMWADTNLGVDGECKIDVGLDLVIWTKHFTKFASYTQTTNSSSGSVGTTTASAPVCSDTKPGSAPSGLTAVAGFNSVTLTWNKASDPVSYYLITYGTSSGSQTYGNPNIGGASTTSYTITNLSGGIKYYFKVRAGNGCAPGDYSNEASTTPSGGFVEGVAPGFEAGVLGESTEQDIEITPTETTKPTSSPEVKGIDTKDWNARNIALISLGSALAILALLLLWRKNKK